MTILGLDSEKVRAAVRRLGISLESMRSRIRRWGPERALSEPKHPHGGARWGAGRKPVPLPDAAVQAGLTHKIIWLRIRNGWPRHIAKSTPKGSFYCRSCKKIGHRSGPSCRVVVRPAKEET